MRPILILSALLLSHTPASARQPGNLACPLIDAHGHHLQPNHTGTLYFGNPAANASQAPDSDNGHVSLFNLPQGGQGYVLACHYTAAPAPDLYPVPPATRSCRQDAASFVCR